MDDDFGDLDLLKPVYVPMPDTIRNLLSSGSTCVEDILRQPLTFRLFRGANPQLINFFVIHINQLLRIAFDETVDTDLSSRAFAVLEHAQPTVTSALLAGQKLNRMACSIIGNESVRNKSLLLNRLSSLSLAALYTSGASFTESCGYILQLVDELAECGVLFLFETLCSPDEDLDLVQKWLIGIGFPQTILKEIDHFPSQTDADRLSRDANVLAALFRIVCLCGSSPILGPHFCTRSFVAALNRTVGDFPDFIENQRWEAFSALYCQTTSENLRGLFQPALELITDPAQCTTRAGVAALDLLAVMATLDRELVPHMARENLPATVLRLMFAHANHTVLQQAAWEFFEAILKVPPLRASVVGELLEVVSFHLQGQAPGARATAFELLRAVEKVAGADQGLGNALKKSSVYIGLVRGKVVEYKEALEAPYGGGMRYPTEEDVHALADRALNRLGF
jgi:hypothetical protein